MWWCNRKRSLLSAAAAALAVLIAGCGFEPLYGRGSVGEVEAQLSSVKIQTISGRVGQQVHNYLLDRINRKGRPQDPLYILSVTLEVDKVRLGIEQDERATRVKLVVLASVLLQDIVTEEVLLERWARSTNSYNIVDSAVATRSAELDAVDRAAREVSDQIRLMLSLYFRRHNPQPA
ncbi:MAG: LPS assembly lipoprotein LptE, partial [Alphaproteobacteria bacterium]|nr:LPS assembly lipoprotein LptE [Alphaproteobacteria bacterium]